MSVHHHLLKEFWTQVKVLHSWLTNFWMESLNSLKINSIQMNSNWLPLLPLLTMNRRVIFTNYHSMDYIQYVHKWLHLYLVILFLLFVSRILAFNFMLMSVKIRRYRAIIRPGFHYTTNAKTTTQKQCDYRVVQSSFTPIALFWLEIGRCRGRNWLNGNQALCPRSKFRSAGK